MRQLDEHRVRPRLGRILGRVTGALLFTTASRTSPMPAHMAGVAVFTEVVASMAAAFLPARTTADLADFMAADGTLASRASTVVSATGTAATGTTAGAAGVTAGGGVRGWEGITI
jgi:hypothetical protein